MSRVFLVLGFVLIMALYSDAQPIDPRPVPCCFDFFPGKIPPQNVVEVRETGGHCTQQGFIVTTVKNRKMCVRENPQKK